MEKKDLQPASVFHYFEEICQVPRPSKKEEKIRAYLIGFAQKHGLEYKEDEAGNILIKKSATQGMEHVKTVILQSHMDMVCEKNKDTEHNFDTDPIQTYVDGEWLKAKGTTLGADNGIGVATQLAVLAADDIKHGPIECLFTVDEETGLTGAFALKEGFMEGDITSVIFKGVHYEIEIVANGFEWLVHTTLLHNVGEHVGINVIPFNIQIMNKPESEDEEAVEIDA